MVTLADVPKYPAGIIPFGYASAERDSKPATAEGIFEASCESITRKEFENEPADIDFDL